MWLQRCAQGVSPPGCSRDIKAHATWRRQTIKVDRGLLLPAACFFASLRLSQPHSSLVSLRRPEHQVQGALGCLLLPAGGFFSFAFVRCAFDHERTAPLRGSFGHRCRSHTPIELWANNGLLAPPTAPNTRRSPQRALREAARRPLNMARFPAAAAAALLLLAVSVQAVSPPPFTIADIGTGVAEPANCSMSTDSGSGGTMEDSWLEITGEAVGRRAWGTC